MAGVEELLSGVSQKKDKKMSGNAEDIVSRTNGSVLGVLTVDVGLGGRSPRCLSHQMVGGSCSSQVLQHGSDYLSHPRPP